MGTDITVMAFALPRGASRTTGNRSRSPAVSNRNTEFHTQSNSQQYLWPSQTDPSRAHCLRNEVIAFERLLAKLTIERDEVTAVLEQHEKSRQRAEGLEHETQQAVDREEARRQELEQE